MLLYTQYGVNAVTIDMVEIMTCICIMRSLLGVYCVCEMMTSVTAWRVYHTVLLTTGTCNSWRHCSRLAFYHWTTVISLDPPYYIKVYSQCHEHGRKDGS